MSRLLLLVPLLACTPPADYGGTGEPGDTSDTNDGRDTGDSADTGDTGSGPQPDLGFDLDGDWAGATLTLTWLDVRTLGTETLAFGDQLLSAAATADPLLVAAGAPPESDVLEADPESAPGMRVAIYVPALHVDDDGDGARSGDETYVGAGAWWPTWVAGDIPASYAAAGVLAGWNVLYVFDEGGPVFGDPMAISLAANIVPRETITLGGSFTGDPDGTGLVLVPGVLFDGGSVDDYLYDAPLEGDWAISLDGPPPSDHLQSLEWLAGGGALEVPIAYADANGSGAFDSGDSALWAACFEGVPAAAVWSPGPTDLWTAVSMSAQGVGAGWFTMTVGDGGGTVLDTTQATSLSIDATCTLGG